MAADAAILGFEARGDDLAVQYSAENAGEAALRLAVYASPDGSAAGSLLHSAPLEDGAVNEAIVDAQLANLDGDEFLLARIESVVEDLAEGAVVSQMGLQGGVLHDAQGVVHIYGTEQPDLIDVYEFGVLGVSFNGAYYAFGLETVSAVMLHSVGADDVISLQTTAEQLDASDGSDTDVAAMDGMAEGESGNPPVITDFYCSEAATNMWMFEGTVTDDGPLTDIQVYIGYWGIFEVTTVNEEGNFSHAIFIDPGTQAIADAYAVDGEAMMSEWRSCYIDNSDSGGAGGYEYP